MDWCPVEWPPRPKQGEIAVTKRKQSGKRAALAGFVGVFILLIMVTAVFGYAWWSERLNITTNASGYVLETILGQKPVTVSVDGKTMNTKTKGKDVRQVLDELGINLNRNDLVNPALSALITRDMAIKVTRVDIKTEHLEAPIAFSVNRVANPNLAKGITQNIRNGKEGLEQQTWQIRYEDGEEVSRTCVARETITGAENGLIHYGTQDTISRGGQTLRFSEAKDMLATAYTYTGYNTATGIPPAPGVAAVDPKVIPLGTRLYIEGYGKATALDTGGSIKGNRIDLFYETNEQAVNWGVRKTKVYVLD
ncbi:3D domain-containing protein [Desulforamulus aquiferis]|uniref:3D domain-containing protein n=1 Tax=Desulforamulus aquiferis TaxID=1397668 RepID=A0AAW7ZEF5_9FIRM|nr:3D domain-containing protein [Desulforamulus aquiferis]MDO7788102.1 3D domain-containing protein [Desulforamulus aquiferis]